MAAAARVVTAEETTGQFVTVSGVITDETLARVQQAVIALTDETKSGKRAVLVLQVEPGTSAFHQVLGLVKFLTSPQASAVKTVAWVPKSLRGLNAAVALACQEIVLEPEADLGDLGRGAALPMDEVQALSDALRRRTNRRVSETLVRAMFDAQVQLWTARVQAGDAAADVRVMTRGELEELQTKGAVIEQTEMIKEAGVPTAITGHVARRLGILAEAVVENRNDVAAMYALPRSALRETTATESAAKVQIIPVRGEINPMLASFVERQIERAVEDGSKLLIFKVESPGGMLHSALQLATTISELQSRGVRAVAYIPKQALSGAAIISMGCDDIYIHADATLGDAGPIELKAGGAFERAPEKIVSFLRTELRSLAEKKHRPPALLEAMSDRSMVVYQARDRETGRQWYLSEAELNEAGAEMWERGPALRETDGNLLLTVNGKRAVELSLAEATVTDFAECQQRLGIPLGTTIAEARQTWVDNFVFVLNRPGITVLILLCGIGCLYLEAHFMTGLLGILSTLCFALFFWSKVLGGTATGLEAILFVIGAACLLLEIFVIPGFGVFGISGLLLVLGSIIMAGAGWTGMDFTTNLENAVPMALQLGSAILGLMVMAGAMAYFLPGVPVLERYVLDGSSAGELGIDGPRLRGMANTSEEALLKPQDRGEALSMLRPVGKAKFGDRVQDVQSEGGFIPAGTPIEVVDGAARPPKVRAVS